MLENRILELGAGDAIVLGCVPFNYQKGVPTRYMGRTPSQTGYFKTRKGAERWLRKHGYSPLGERL